MPEPDPIWGLHVAPGAIAAALVGRSGDAYEVRETLCVDAPEDAAGLVAATGELLRRPGVSGRASLIALPDHELAVGTGKIPSDELYLNDEEVYHHLHDFAPFEPGEGQLVYRAIGKRDDRLYAVAAIPERALDGLEAYAATFDEGWHGLGLSTTSLVRGARALGLVDGRTFLVNVQAGQTVVVAVEGTDERRYLLAAGLASCDRTSGTTGRLGGDLARLLAYHSEVAMREKTSEGTPPSGDVVLVGPHAARARELLAGALGDRLAPPSRAVAAPERVTARDGGPLPDAARHACAGAVGAALEAFLAPEERLVLRHPPDEVPEYAGPTTVAAVAAPSPRRSVVIVAILAFAVAGVATAAWVILGGGEEPLPRTTPTRKQVVETDEQETEDGAAPAADGGADARTAAAARPPLARLALRVAHARAQAASLAALAAAPGLRGARSYDVREIDGALHATLQLDVGGAANESLRAALQAAAGRAPGVEQVQVDAAGTAVRLTFRCPIAPLPDAGGGERVPFDFDDDPATGLATDEPWTVPAGADGRPDLNRARLAALIEQVEVPGAPTPRLTLAESTFALSRIQELLDLHLARLTARVAATPRLTPRTGTGRIVVTVDAAPDRDVPVAHRRLPNGAWVADGVLAAGSERLEIEVAGASGRYEVRLGTDGDAADGTTDVVVDVSTDLVGRDPATGRPVFRLVRPWREGAIAAEVTVDGPGTAVRAEKDGVVLDPGLAVDAVETREETETVTEQVPEFLPDGRVRRDEQGRPVLVERTVERSVEVLEVRARDAEGTVRTWVRKMTDG